MDIKLSPDWSLHENSDCMSLWRLYQWKRPSYICERGRSFIGAVAHTCTCMGAVTHTCTYKQLAHAQSRVALPRPFLPKRDWLATHNRLIKIPTTHASLPSYAYIHRLPVHSRPATEPTAHSLSSPRMFCAVELGHVFISLRHSVRSPPLASLARSLALCKAQLACEHMAGRQPEDNMSREGGGQRCVIDSLAKRTWLVCKSLNYVPQHNTIELHTVLQKV